MPIYEYVCTKCNHRQEDLRAVASRYADRGCEKCGKESRLAISPPAHPVMNPAVPVKKPHNM